MDLGERYEHIEYFLESFREYWEDKCPGMNFLSVLRSLDLRSTILRASKTMRF